MKRAMIALLGFLFVTALCTAQARLGNFSQRGNATQEMQADGLSAAHSSLPIGSKVRVTNVTNNTEIEVTITQRIPSSPDRVIDLSPGAAFALDLDPGGTVLLSVPSPPRPRPLPPETPVITLGPDTEPEEIEPEPVFIVSEPEIQPEPQIQPEPEIQPVPAVASAPEQPQLPMNIIINNFFATPETEQGERRRNRDNYDNNGNVDLNYLAWLTLMALDARDAREAREMRETRDAREESERRVTAYSMDLQPVTPPGYTSNTNIPDISVPDTNIPVTDTPNNNIMVIPGLPDPDSGKIFQLLIGNFSEQQNADHIYQLLRDSGFDAVKDQRGDIYRVYAQNVPSQIVLFAVQRLGIMGFSHVWVQE